MQSPTGLAALAHYAGERDKATAGVNAAGVHAAGTMGAADLAAAAHEAAAKTHAGAVETAAGLSAAAQGAASERAAQVSLANASTAAGVQREHNQILKDLGEGKLAAAAPKDTGDYNAYAPKILGIKSIADATPEQLELFNKHKGNLGSLANAAETHTWWTTHGSPENVGGFLENAKSKGVLISPEQETLFRAQASSRDPGFRSQFGPQLEAYTKNQPSGFIGRRVQDVKTGLAEAARQVGEAGYYQ